MNIRLKLTLLPFIAILIPLLGGIFYIRSAARASYEQQIGVLYLTIAKDMEDALDRDVVGQLHNLEGWIRLFEIDHQLDTLNAVPLDESAVEEIEGRWPSLGPNDEPLRTILNNSIAKKLVSCQKINPHFAELMLTDREGRLVAATNPTTDYWQADEGWWIDATRSSATKSTWTHSIMYDASAGVQAMDIALPIRNKDGELLGVVKGSLNAVDVLRQLAPDPWNAEITRDILFSDGRLFARLNAEKPGESIPKRVQEEAFASLLASEEACRKVELYPGETSLAVCIPVGMMLDPASGASSNSVIYVLVHREYASAIGPVTDVIWTLTKNGTLLVVFTALVGFFLSTIWFARPLGKLRHAALRIGNHVQRQEKGTEVHRSIRDVESSLKQLDSIRTKDEMQDLAEVFAHMGGRVLNFHRELERELTRATEEINEDLVMAREFQEALLPDSYPQIPMPEGSDLYHLAFSHIYRPAQSVSGDFFDISEISKHCVRIVVADVMGHGARSALMTAILHALISDAAKNDGDPAHLLHRMNEEFHAIGKRIGDMVFVTAIHVMIDTHMRTIRYAVAGHPSPLVVDHATGSVDMLIPEGQPTPAAGLFPETVYEGHECRIDKEQTLLLYTDGVTEARNPQDEEFGANRLIRALKEFFREDRKAPLPQYVLEILESYMDTAVAMDDICLVSIDISKAKKR